MKGKKQMLRIEEKINTSIRKNILVWAFCGVTLLSIILRILFLNIRSTDMNTCLLPWYDIIKKDGFGALSYQVGNYNMLYQFIIVLLTYLPIPAIYAYKLFSILFDYVLACGVAYITGRAATENKKLWQLLGYAFVILCPSVILNSAAWGQCDAIYVSFIILALVALDKERYTLAFVFYGLAFAFKLQAVFALPFFLFFYFMKRRFSILKFLWLPGMLVITAIPSLLHGRRLIDIFIVYIWQISNYDFLSMNYPTFWAVITNANLHSENYDMFRAVAFAFTIALLFVMFIVWCYRNIELSYRNLLYIAFLTAYTCVLFLPAMHERYGYLYEILAIAIVFYNRKSIPACIALLIIPMSLYGMGLFGLEIQVTYVMTLINLAIYVYYIILLNKEILQAKE